MPYVIGLDIGTSATKALLVDRQGRVVAGASHDYPLSRPAPGWAEQDPEDWWEAVRASVRALLERARVAPQEVAALGLSGQMHGAVVLDDSLQVIRPAILWCDVRTSAQCREMEARIGREDLIARTGNPALEGFTAPKLLWLKEHEPEALRRARVLLLPKDYVRFRMTGQLAMEISDAAGTNLFDVSRGEWDRELVQQLGLDPGLLPPVAGSAEVAGRLTVEAAALLGLVEGTPVVGGGADNACGAVGSGVVHPGRALVSLGSSGVVLVQTQVSRSPGSEAVRPPIDPQGRLHTFNHAVPGAWYSMGVMLAAGISYAWLRDEVAQLESAAAEAASAGGGAGVSVYELMDRQAASVPAGSEGLFFLPYLNGERTPHADANARGAFIGISAAHRHAHLIRATMEGITFGLRDSLELIRGMGVRVERARAIGGGAKSPLWQRILASALRVTIELPEADEGPAYGAALLAAVGAGFYSSVEEAADRCVRIAGTVEPDPKDVERYEEAYGVFRQLYPALRPHFPAMVRMAATGGR